MSFPSFHRTFSTFVGLLALLAPTAASQAQLEVTEVLFNSVQDSRYEWFEIRNTGAADVDMMGYVIDDDDGNALATDVTSVAVSAIIPAGGVAVGYNAVTGEDSFRAAWNLAPTVPLVPIAPFPGLNNSGDIIGIWQNRAAYEMDLADVDPNDAELEVVPLIDNGFTNAAAVLDFGAMEFPVPTATESIVWNTMGGYQDGTQWGLSVSGENGAYTSLQTTTDVVQINDTADFGNPGLIPGGEASTGLLITEIMFHPASENDLWEWVEIYNNTGVDIDFGATNHVLDDDDGSVVPFNLTSGTLADGEVGILIDGGVTPITEDAFKAAWGQDLNVFVVPDFPEMSNGGDVLAIWDDGPAYDNARTVSDDNTGAVALIGTANGEYPNIDDGMASVYLSDLSDPTSFVLATLDDGLSFNAQPALDVTIDHEGGDIGSPGMIGDVVPVVCDLDSDLDCDTDDINQLIGAIVDSSDAGDMDGDGDTDINDRAAWLSAAGLQNGLSGAYLVGDANLDGTVEVSDLNSVGINWLNTEARLWTEGNFDGILGTEIQDLNAVGVNWLMSVPLAADGQAVPEPSALALFGLAGLSLLLRRHRGSSGCSTGVSRLTRPGSRLGRRN